MQTAKYILIDCFNYKEKIDKIRKKLLLTNIIIFFDTVKEIGLLIKYFKFTKINIKK